VIAPAFYPSAGSVDPNPGLQDNPNATLISCGWEDEPYVAWVGGPPERRRRFVGRVAEKNLFRSVLSADEPPFNVLYIFGSGGVGKTTLLREFATICEERGVPASYVDACNVEPSFAVGHPERSRDTILETVVANGLAGVIMLYWVFVAGIERQLLPAAVRAQVLFVLSEAAYLVYQARHAKSA
jgi:hypothetical protein